MQHQFTKLQGKKVLITGGKGYIGHIASVILESLKCDVWILDVSENSHSFQNIEQIFQCSLLDENTLGDIFRNHSFDVVVHLASLIQVSESVANPEMYHLNNVVGTKRLLKAMKGYCSKIIFASSAAVYGNLSSKATESKPCNPTSPYGENKLEIEELLKASDIDFIILRLFNVAGSILHHSTGHSLGEDHTPETHLIPLVIQRHLRDEPVLIFGDNHSTPDGTCIREYVHVLDVVNTIAISIQYLMTHSAVRQLFNVSSGIGYSVKEIISTLSKIGQEFKQEPIKTIIEEPREGDPASITSSLTKIQNTLHWQPEHSELNVLLTSCWLHHIKQ